MRLKRITALFITLVLVTGMFLPGIQPSASVQQAGWFVDFSGGQDAIGDAVFIDPSLKTEAAYSEEAGAAVFTSTQSDYAADTRTPGIILGGTVTSNSTKPLSVSDASVTDYPIVAIRLKLSHVDIRVDRFDWTTDELETTGSGMWRSMTGATQRTYSGTSALLPTTEWQTVVIDTSKDTNGTTLGLRKGNWSGFRFLFLTPAGCEETTSVAVAWIGVFANVAEVPRTGDAPLLIDFSDEDMIESTVATESSLHTELSYDAEEQALLMSSTDSYLAAATRTPGAYVGYRKAFDVYNSPVENYPVIAAYIKMSDETLTFDRFDWTTTAYEASGEATPWRDMSTYISLQPTTEWQLIYVDTSLISNANDRAWLKGLWSGFRLLFKSAEGREAASVKVRWIGTFASVEDAKKQAGMVVEPPSVGEMFIDFSESASVIDYVSTASSLETEYGYDETEQALRMTSKVENLTEATRTPGVIVGSAGRLTERFSSSVTDYPVIAVYMKLSNGAVTFDRFDWTTTVYEASGEATPWRSMTNYMKFQRTTDWQLVYIDTRTLTEENDTKWLSGDWSGFRLLLKTPAGLSEPVSATVKWIGTFASVDDAKKRAGIVETGPVNGQMLIEFNDRTNIDKYVRSNASLNTEFDYSAADDALVMTSTVTNLTEATRTPGVIIGGSGLLTEDYITPVSSYPVIAVYMKLSNDTVTFDRFDWTTTTFEASGEPTPWRSMTNYMKFQRTTDWQLVYIDTRTLTEENDTKWLSGNWSGFRLLLKTPAGLSEPVSAAIKWIGVFASIDDAKRQAGIEIVPPKTGPMLVEFNNRPVIDKYVKTDTSLNTEFDYSVADDALVMTSTVTNLTEATRTPGVIIGGSGLLTEDYSSSVVEYPVIAAYVKLSDKTVTFDRFDWTTTVYEASGEATPWRNATNYFTLKPTTDWQLIYFDTSKITSKNDTVWLDGNWSGFRILGKTAEGQSEPAEISVKWIGTFATISDAKTLAGENGGSDTETPGLWVFDSEQSLEQVIWSNLDDTDISFDAQEKAMRVMAVDAASGANRDGKLETNVAHFTLEVDGNITCSQYRYLAVRIKLENPTARSGWFAYSSSDAQEAGLQYLNMIRPKYEQTDEWQTVLINCSEENAMEDYFTGYWSGLSFDLALSGFASENDSFLISWIGLFKSEKEAMERSGITVKPPVAAVTPEPVTTRSAAWPIAIGVSAAVVAVGAVCLVVFRRKIFKGKKA